MKKINRKKIAFFLPNLKIGGAEKVSLILLNSLSDHLFEKYLVVLDYKGYNKKKISSKIKIIKCEKPKLRSNLLNIYSLICKNKFDIIFSTFFHINFFLCFLKLFLNFKLVIRESNDPYHIINNHRFSNIISLCYKFFYPKTDTIIVPAKYLMKRLSNLSIKKNKIKVIYNPVYKSKVKLSSNTKKNYFCAIGRLTFQKGFDKLIKLVNKSEIEKLLIIGNGHEKNYLQKIANKKKIFFIKERNIKKYLINSKALLFSSRWEGMPNIVLESLSFGTKVLSISKIDSILELNKIVKKNSLIICNQKNFNHNVKKIIKTKKIVKKNLLPINFNFKFAINKYERVLI